MGDIPTYASFSLTHVHYNPNDPISYLCAWLALLPQGLCVVYATLIWSTREAEIFLMFAGQLACEAINFVLKRIIREERPKVHTGKGYGMPSSHAQFVAFFAVHLTLFLLIRHKPRQFSREKGMHNPLTFGSRAVISLGVLGTAAAVAWSRIYLSYHTSKQVLVGLIAGTICAVGWFTIVELIRSMGRLEQVLDMEIVKYFRVRDLVVVEDLPQSGWEAWEQRRKDRAAKRRLGNGEVIGKKMR